MLDDLRNHDPVPTEKERGWMDASAVEMAVRLVILVGVSTAIGFAASLAPDKEPHRATATALTTR
jgi:hypothetical protein